MFYRLAHRHAPEVSHSSIFISVTDCRLTDFYQEFKWQHSNTHNTASLVTVGSGEGVGRRLLQLVHCSLPPSPVPSNSSTNGTLLKPLLQKHHANIYETGYVLDSFVVPSNFVKMRVSPKL